MPIGKSRFDEESLVREFPSLDQKAQGAFFTPAPLVDEVIATVDEYLLPDRRTVVVDPSCGAGAFLSAAANAWPEAKLLGLELHDEAAQWTQRRIPRAEVLQGDALRDGFDALTSRIPRDAYEVWIGNPPYNGTSSVLKDRATYERLVELLPEAVPKGTSLRDDFAFFLLRVARRLETREGMVAFVTPASLIDAFLYAPLRRSLLKRLELREVIELGGGVFRGARVKTCVTVWATALRNPAPESVTLPRSMQAAAAAKGTERRRHLQLVTSEDGPTSALGPAEAQPDPSPPAEKKTFFLPEFITESQRLADDLDRPVSRSIYRARSVSGPFERSQLPIPDTFAPTPPDYLLRPPPPMASVLDQRWRSEGEPLTTLIPVSTPGLKTRFDELLVADDAEVLLERVDSFLRAAPTQIEAFAIAHGIPSKHLAKLETLKALVGTSLRADRACIRPFYRYAGARHRHRIPESARAWCYLDRQLIPRGDHRFRGDYDPHACDVKLVFNVRELPLSAALLDRPGCVHDHRHARFAPLYVPRAIRENGLGAATHAGDVDLTELVPNLSPRGLEWAEEVGGPRALYEALVRFINSDDVQRQWAPAFGAIRELHVPFAALTSSSG